MIVPLTHFMHCSFHFIKQLPEVFCKKCVVRNFAKFTGKHLRPEGCNFIKNETLAQMLSCEFCEISKNTFFYRTPLVAASAFHVMHHKYFDVFRGHRAKPVTWNALTLNRVMAKASTEVSSIISVLNLKYYWNINAHKNFENISTKYIRVFKPL